MMYCFTVPVRFTSVIFVILYVKLSVILLHVLIHILNKGEIDSMIQIVKSPEGGT